MSGLDFALTPEMNMPMMLAYTTYPNAGSENAYMVLFSIDYGIDMDDAYIDMKEATNVVKASLPEDALDPMIMKMSSRRTFYRRSTNSIS